MLEPPQTGLSATRPSTRVRIRSEYPPCSPRRPTVAWRRLWKMTSVPGANWRISGSVVSPLKWMSSASITVIATGFDQHMPETTPDAGRHWEASHEIDPEPGWAFGPGSVHSKHRQAVTDPGSLTVLARADDGVIEAVGDPSRPFRVGVQWHPERTEGPLGQPLFDALVAACVTRNQVSP